MASVKWIKIVTDIFDDEKMLLIETMPDADSIIVVWFKLLCLAGKTNNSGVFILNERIPYTDEMLAAIFRRNVNTVRLALKTFQDFGMVEIVDNVITIPNWSKHQTLDAYERQKERDRLKKKQKRAEQKALISGSSADASGDCPPDTSGDASGDVPLAEEDKEKDIDLEENYIIAPPAATSPTPKKPVRHKYGEYNNVLLTDEDLAKLKDEFPDWQARIERLSIYMASTGKSYKSHLATIRNWARKDAEQPRRAGQAGAGKRLDDLDFIPE